MPKFCTKCGAKLEEGQKFCRQCGAPVRVNTNTEEIRFPEEPETTTPVSVEDRKEDTVIIPVAPASQQTENKQPEKPKDGKKESKKLSPVLIGLLLAGALGLGALIGATMNKNSQSEAASATESPEQQSENDPELDNAGEPVYAGYTDAGAGLTDNIAFPASEDTLVQNFTKNLDYTEKPIGYVNVKTARIRFRTGPSTSSTDTKKRTAVGDVYDVYEKTTGEGYNWYRVSKKEWIADNAGKWMTFTAYKYASPDEYIDAQYVSRILKDAYDSYLTSINNNGAFKAYLSRCSSDLSDVFEERYSIYHNGLEIENKAFEFDMTDYSVQDLGAGNYLCTCYAWITNNIYSRDTGQAADHTFGVKAVLCYAPEYGDQLLISLDAAPDYNPAGHSMLKLSD